MKKRKRSFPVNPAPTYTHVPAGQPANEVVVDAALAKLDGADEAKVRNLQRQVADSKHELGDLQLGYEATKARIVKQLADLTKRADGVIVEVAQTRGLDPATVTFDWNTLAFARKPS